MQFGIGLMFVILFGFVVYLAVVLIFLFITWIFGAPFQPTSMKRVEEILELSNVKKGDKVADLGSGDGRIVIAFAENPKVKEAHGFEINPFLVLYSRYRIYRKGLQKKAFIHWRSFWNENLGKFDIIVLFQIGYVMKKLEGKIDKESRKQTRIVSHYWKFPGWKIIKKTDEVYLYKK